MNARTVTGVHQTAHMELVNNGRLVYSCVSPIPKGWDWYEAKRCVWLTKHRKRPSPLSFRQGKRSPLTVGFFVLTLIWR